MHGSDGNLRQKRWKQVKVDLYELGMLSRRIGDWAWVPTEKAKALIHDKHY